MVSGPGVVGRRLHPRGGHGGGNGLERDVGILGLGRQGCRIRRPVNWVTRTTTSAITTTAPPTRMPMRIRFARSSAARFSAARAGSRSCAGPSTCFDWSLGRQRSEPIPAKGINALERTRPFGDSLRRRSPGLPEACHRSPSTKVTVMVRWCSSSANCQAPATPACAHQLGAVHRRADDDVDPLRRDGRAPPRVRPPPAVRPSARPRRTAPTAGPAAPRRSGPRRAAAWPGRRTRGSRSRRGGSTASCSGTGRAGCPSRPRRPGSVGSAPSGCPNDDALDRELLGEVVELVPGVVGLVGGRIGHLGEREESQHAARLPAARCKTLARWPARRRSSPGSGSST